VANKKRPETAENSRINLEKQVFIRRFLDDPAFSRSPPSDCAAQPVTRQSLARRSTEVHTVGGWTAGTIRRARK
jgi:hypothetical protein